MAILDTVKKVGLRVKTAAGYITYKLGSEFVQMDDGKDLQTAFDDLNDELNSNIEMLNDKDSVSENSYAMDGRALKMYKVPSGGNLTYGCWDEGIYTVPGYATGAPNNWGGACLVTHTRKSDGSFDTYVKTMFCADCKVYVMRQGADGVVQQNWTAQS